MGWVLEPSTLLVLSASTGVILHFFYPTKLSRNVLTVSVLGIALCTWTPVGVLLLGPLENRFPKIQPPQQITGIIVLGGAIRASQSKNRDTISLNFRAERMLAFVKLAIRYPNAKLVFSGGAGGLQAQSANEADEARKLLVGLFPSRKNIIFEDRSRNTRDNALFSKDLVRPLPSERWLLITSAADMPRAVGCFAKLKWDVIPYPVDYHTGLDTWSGQGLVQGFEQINWAVHEWIGLVYYRLRGWTPSIFPGPPEFGRSMFGLGELRVKDKGAIDAA
ncbi:MAG: YdcF family protein [Armatimonadota bacterium]